LNLAQSSDSEGLQ
jgi:hypothetical protein